MKRFFSLLLSATLAFGLFFGSLISVYAAEVPSGDWSMQFGDGYSNMSQNDGKFLAVMTAIFAAKGIKMSPALVPGANDSVSAKQAANGLLQAAYSADQSFYNFVVDNTNITWENNRGTIHFSDTFWKVTQPGLQAFPDNLTEFYEYLFGDNALSGNPISASVDTPYTIVVNGNEVVPWTLNVNLFGLSSGDGVLSPNIFSTRGEYLLPTGDSGNYFEFWDEVYSNNSSHNKTYSWSYLDTNENTRTVSANNPFVARKANNATFGAVNDMYMRVGVDNRYFMWNMYNSGQQAINAWLPCLTNQGHFAILNYSYIYDGTFQASSWKGKSYLIFEVASQNSSHAKPKTSTQGSFDIASDGIDATMNNLVNNTLTVYGDSYEDVYNNFFYGDDVVTTPYVDPSTWDTSHGGTATPDGNGGFNIDLGSFHMPNLNINWSLDGLTNKFPFSIPFDIVRFFNILNAEPVAPAIQGEVDLKITTWEIDFNLSDYDDIAELFRNLTYITFVICLIIYTRDFLKR